MPTSTVDTFLMIKTGSTETPEKLVCIKDYPDIGGTPSSLETTTLCDHQQTYIEGLKSGEQLKFTANYDKDDWEDIEDLKGTEQHLGLWFGATSGTPDGHEGKFNFNGFVSVYLSGKGVDEVREMVVIVTPSSEVTFA